MKSNSPKRPEFCLCCVVNHDIILSPLMMFRGHYRWKPTKFPTRDSPVVLGTSQIKTRTHPQHEARLSPCCIRPHSFPRSKGRSTPRTVYSFLVLRRHSFPGSKGRSSAPTQVASHHESWSLVLSFLLLLLPLLLPCCNQLPL